MPFASTLVPKVSWRLVAVRLRNWVYVFMSMPQWPVDLDILGSAEAQAARAATIMEVLISPVEKKRVQIVLCGVAVEANEIVII